MTTPAQPRHARAEIRAFAKWLRGEGWTYESQDSSGHTLWSHPKASGLFKLPETPTHFSVQRARREAWRMVGQQAPGKRKPKVAPRTVPPAARRPVPQAPRQTLVPREDDRDFRFFDRLMREAPGSY